MNPLLQPVTSIFQFCGGLLIVLLILHDVFQSIVVPRWTSRRWRCAPWIMDHLWPLWRKVGLGRPDGEKREDFLGTFAPFALMGILVFWVVFLILGFAVMFWALREQIHPSPQRFSAALYLSGITTLTIGYGDITPSDTGARLVALCAAASGLAIFALVISLLFTLYAEFQRREVGVLTLDARAGAPPSGLTLLETYAQFDLLETLPQFFDEWEKWSAGVLESHIAYPILPFFRSSHDRESWVAAMGAVLDAATLLITVIEPGERCGSRPLGSAHLMYRMGCHTVIDLSHWFGYRFDEDPNPHPGVERGEFEMARRRLEKAGFQTRGDEESWQQFFKFRSAYAASLNELAKHFATPPAQWIGDRSIVAVGHRKPERRKKSSQI